MSRRKYPRLWSPIAVGIMGSALAAAVGVSRGWGAAVSYTHLDVYKRQVKAPPGDTPL